MKAHSLDFPVRLDSLHEVLDEIRAAHTKVSRLNPLLNECRLVGESRAMRSVVEQVEQVAKSNATVLIIGESGTGKEIVARQIHDLSGRTGEFVAINCGAIPENLLESELFGHEKGAFTGASKAREGKFEQAQGGTFFLDEIGDMPPFMQVKLLRVLEERVIERLGSSNAIPIDVRVVAATHRNLADRIDQGKFREDLYYRLSVFPIEVAPLRERKDDIRLLITEFVTRLTKGLDRRLQFTDAALACLEEYEWPGNIRELVNLVERLLVVCPEGLVDAQDLPWPVNANRREIIDEIPEIEKRELTAPVLPRNGLALKQYLDQVERDLIERALVESDDVVQQAALRLGMGRTTLVEKIRRHKIRDK